MDQRRLLREMAMAVTEFLKTDTDPFTETEYDEIYDIAHDLLNAIDNAGFDF